MPEGLNTNNIAVKQAINSISITKQKLVEMEANAEEIFAIDALMEGLRKNTISATDAKEKAIIMLKTREERNTKVI